MDVRAVLVMLAVLMPLLQASGETVNVNVNTGGNTGGSCSADKSQETVIPGLLEELLDLEGQDPDPATGACLSHITCRDKLITLLLEQNKEMQEQNNGMQEQITELQEQIKDVADLKNQVKNLTADLCHTKMTCCNKTKACPSGYELFCEKPDTCYKFSTDEKYYTDAKSACQADGGHLAMPKDKATNDLLVKQIKARSLTNIWIGLTDEVTEGTWVWEDGTKLGTGWNNWELGRPDPIDINHLINCAILYNGDEWVDLTCGSVVPYICEVKATAAP